MLLSVHNVNKAAWEILNASKFACVCATNYPGYKYLQFIFVSMLQYVIEMPTWTLDVYRVTRVVPC